jgi:hypothetical protein
MDLSQEIRTRYSIDLPADFLRLYRDGMLDWMEGYPDPLPEGVDWKRDIYPKLDEHPPALFHSGGDLVMMSPEKILAYAPPVEWDTDTYTIIPFAKGDEGNLYALFKSPQSGEEIWVAMVWEDEDEAEILARSMRDFIFRRMVEAADEADRDTIDREYRGQDVIEAYRADLKRDLATIRPYLDPGQIEALEALYDAPVATTMVSYAFQGPETIEILFARWIDFEYLDHAFALAP